MAVNFLMTAIDEDENSSTSRDSIESLINKLDGQIHRISGQNTMFNDICSNMHREKLLVKSRIFLKNLSKYDKTVFTK